MWNVIVLEVRACVRSLRKTAGAYALAVAALGLAAAAVVVLSAYAYAIFLRPLPFRDPDSLHVPMTIDGEGRLLWKAVSPFDAEIVRRLPDPPATLTTFLSGEVFASTPEEAIADGVRGTEVDHAFWDVLGVAPIAGRPLVERDAQAGAFTPALISDDLWRARYGRDAGLLGRTIDLGGQRLTVVGVMPAGFDFPQGTNVWVPLRPMPGAAQFVYLHAVFRLAPGVPVADAERLLLPRLGSHVQQAGTFLLPLERASRPGQSLTIVVFLAAGLITFAIGWIQMASLQLSRAIVQSQEIATRVAIGASRATAIAPIAIAGGFVALTSAAVAAIVLPWLAAFLAQLLPGEVVGTTVVQLGTLEWVAAGGLVLAGLALFLGACLIASTWHFSRGGRRNGRRWATVSVSVGQVATTTVLLHTASLLTASYVRVEGRDLGFDPTSVYSVAPRFTGLAPAVQQQRMLQLEADLKGVPGVGAVAVSDAEVLGRGGILRSVRVGRSRATVRWRVVGADYFEVLRVPGAVSEAFTGPVAVISESLARRAAMSGADLWVHDSLRQYRVIGVVRNLQRVATEEAPFDEVYTPAASSSFAAGRLLLRVDGAPSAVLPAVAERILREPDRSGYPSIRASADILRLQQAPIRARSVLLLMFSVVTGLVTVLGIHSRVSQSVAERQREFAVHAALGAAPSDLRNAVLKSAVGPVLVSLLVGCAGGIAAGRFLEAYLFGVAPFDLRLLAIVGLMVVATALAASIPSARRAAAVEPGDLLRSA